MSTIENLRAAIYQTTESEGELKKLHEDMIQLLIVVEKKLIDDFLKKNWKFQTVADLQKETGDDLQRT